MPSLMRHFHRMDIPEFLRRYEESLKRADFSNRKATELAGVKEDSTRNPRRKGTSPDILSVIKLAKVLDVSPFYFLEPLGITPELLEHRPARGEPGEFVQHPEELGWLRLYRSIDKAKRPMVAAMVRGAIDSDAA
ncbi:hypothetical protein [Acidomonas methanolica]|nr:hypothetical protein [Acidomonas methanolica]